MNYKGIVTIAAFILLVNCKKKGPGVVLEETHKISGIVTIPNGTPLKGVLVSFVDGTNRQEVTTNASGQYSFEESGNGTKDLYFDGNPFKYLNMRDRRVDFGGFDRTFDKMMVPWEIEELDYLSTNFSDTPEKAYSLVHYNFDELKMKPSDFQNLSASPHLNNYESTFTSAQTAEETNITVNFYSMPKNSGYTLDNDHTISYSDVQKWRKVLSISTTTTPIGVFEPVKVNLAAAYADHADYDHSGTIIMVSEEINETLDVTTDVDLLEIRLPYGDDYQL